MNAAFLAVMNLDLYTDRAVMPNGEIRVWHRSPISRLYIADRQILLVLQLICAALSVITAVLLLFGVRSSTVRKVQIISTAASAVLFVVILIVTANINVKYA